MYSILSILVLCFTIGKAQTPFDVLSSHDNGVSTQGVEALSVASYSNPWIGAKLLYNIQKDVSQSFLFGGRAQYTPVMGSKYAIPLVTNITAAVGDSASNGDGVGLGIFPFYILSGGDRYKLVAHSGLDYRFKPNQATSANEFKFLIGLEVAFYGNDGAPFTLSVAPETTITGGTSAWDLGVTAIVPIASGLGVLFEAQVPFKGSTSTVSVGVAYNGQSK